MLPNSLMLLLAIKILKTHFNYNNWDQMSYIRASPLRINLNGSKLRNVKVIFCAFNSCCNSFWVHRALSPVKIAVLMQELCLIMGVMVVKTVKMVLLLVEIINYFNMNKKKFNQGNIINLNWTIIFTTSFNR